MSGALRSLIAALLCLVPWAAAVADEPPRPARPSPWRGVAEKAIQAFDTKDEAALAALARQRLPSPWLVGDGLVRLGRADVAEAYARAAKPSELDALLRYLEQERTLPPDAAAQAAVAAADAAFAKRDFEGALAALDGVKGRGVVGLFVLNARGLALANLSRLAEAQATLLETVDHLEHMGWTDGVGPTLVRAHETAARRGDRAGTVEILKRILALARTRGNAKDVAGATIDLGSALQFVGDVAGAEALLREGIELARAAGERQFEANALTNLGQLLQALRRPDEAEPLLAAGLALHEALGNQAYAARARGGLAAVKLSRGDLAGAIALYEQSVVALEGLKDWGGLSAALRVLAVTQASRGDPAAAEASARRALEAAETSRSPAARVDALIALAKVLRIIGRKDEGLARAQEAFDLATGLGHQGGALQAALELATSALAVNDLATTVQRAEVAHKAATQLRDENARITAQSLLACGLARSGDTGRALTLMREAASWVAAHGSVKDQAHALANLGFVHTLRGEYAAAIEQTLAAKALFARLGENVSVAETLGNLGGLYLSVGDPERALAAMEEARQRTVDLPDLGMRAACEINLGLVLTQVDRPDEAREALERGLAWAVQGQDRLWRVNAETLLADLALRQGQYPEAAARYAEAARLADELSARASLALAQAGLSGTLRLQGKVAEALTQAEEAVRTADGTDAPDILRSAYLKRARARADLGQTEGALADVRAAADWLGRSTAGLSTVSGDAGALWLLVLDLGVALAAKANDVETAFEFIERARAGRLLEGLGGRDALRDGAVPQDLIAAERKANADVITARSRLARASRASARAERQALEMAEQAQREVVERIQAASRTAAAAAFPHAVTTAQVRATLAPEEAFVAYALLREKALAVVITRDTARLVDLGEREVLGGVIEALVGERTGMLADGALVAAREALLTPLGLPASTTRLIVSPHDATCFVPFQALAGARAVVYAPSATTRVLLATHPSEGGRGVLALGDPDYAAKAAAGGALALRGRTLVPLPGTREEVRSIGDVVLLGEEASEAELARAIGTRPRWLAVHLACHGLVDPDKPLRSALAVTADATNDGLLSVLDVYRMRVPADLVVLSACESGRGALSASEGVVGFSGAFLLAGADRVISSLWKVDDDATRALMVEFYRLWNPRAEPWDPERAQRVEGLPAAEALRRAQEHVRTRPAWSHPRYWAAWQLWGRSD